MCRCSAKRKFILIWTPESEMNETISRVEKRGEELNDSITPPIITNDDPEDADRTSRDRLIHQTYEVSCNPICTIDSSAEPVPSDSSIADVSIEPNDPPQLTSTKSSVVEMPTVLPSDDTAAAVTPVKSMGS